MKCAFTTLGCPDWSFEKVLEEAPRLGYQGIEVRGLDGEMMAEKMAQFQPGVQQDTKRRLAKAGLVMCGLGTDAQFDVKEYARAAVEHAKKAIDVCAAMGIPAIRVFGDAIGNQDEAEVIARVTACVKELCDYAKGTDVQVLLEVHGEFNTVERVLPVAEGVASDNFGVLWDVAHSDKAYGDDFMRFYTPLKKYIKHTHFKDHVREADGKFRLCKLGDGDIPILPIVRTLLADGYDGWFSLEWEKKWHPELPDAAEAFADFISILQQA